MNKLAQINDLQPIARRMRERQEQIEADKKEAFKRIGDLIVLAAEQGQDCLLAKTKLGKNLKWSDWLHAHVPQLSEADAAKYERITTEQLIDPRQCVFAFLPPAERDTAPTERTPPKSFEVVAGYITKLKATLRDDPIEKWPQDRVALTRKELEPLVCKLWPERFERA